MKNPFEKPTVERGPCKEDILYFVYEREVIRLQKDRGMKKPWTDDEILSKYKFCNVRRRDDRVSQWIFDKMLKPFALYQDVWFVSAIARYINWPPMLEILLKEKLIPTSVYDFDTELFGDRIDEVTCTGGKAWGAAYMTYPGKVEKNIGKGLSTARYILRPLQDAADNIREAISGENSVAETVSSMIGSYGWSTFMAGQVAADLTYIRHLGEAEDLYTWAPMGPGSQRGLNRLNKHKLNHEWKQSEFNDALIDIRNQIIWEIEIDDLTLHDVQSIMCECDKYWRVLHGEGAPRSMYQPETRF
jgi:hypothetical protein